jgi:hypothetical protein
MAGKVILGVSISLHIKSIKHNDINEKYIHGDYSIVTKEYVKRLGKISIKPPPHNGVLTTIKNYSTNEDEGIFIRYNNLGNIEKVLTTNVESYRQYIRGTNGGYSGDLPIVGKCNWCQRPIISPPVGIPIKLEVVPSSSSLVFYVDQPYYCRFECCYSGLNRDHKDALYINSETLLKLLYSKVYPNATDLVPAPDWRLLDINGGPLSSDEYDKNTHRYLRTVNVILAPVKVVYTNG